MFDFFKNMFCHCDSKAEYTAKLEAVHQQEKDIREQLSEKQIDRELKHTMDASDPVAKY